MRGSGLAHQQKQVFESVYANVSLLRGVLEGKLGVVENETAALRDFLQTRLGAPWRGEWTAGSARSGKSYGCHAPLTLA